MVELKHLAPYLPYGLKMFYTSLDGREHMSWTLRDGTLTEAIVNQNKPILRNLSDLTKEIEVGGERFVPLYKINNDFGVSLDADLDLGIETVDYQNWNYQPILQCYEITQKLFEWKFDLFKLIESGDAIDINTL